MISDGVAERLGNQRRLVDRPQLAEIVGLSVATIDRRIRAGKISCIRDGRRVLFDPAVTISELAANGGADHV
ncbi:MAG: DNA-binding protein [Planctomycetales bacterium]|nr:DNA-binding protein [Planctomycetales bacterium]